jgi:hypothetical protein
MLKYINYTFFLLGLFSVASYAQDLQVPQTPAFSILEYEPSAVMRPTSVKKLSSDILNSFDAEGKLIMNLGIEVSPYWLTSRPELSREAFLNPKPMQNLFQTFSISAATVRDTVTGKNNLGFGFRTQIVRGKLSPEFEKYDLQLKKMEEAIGMIAIARSLSGNVLTSRDAIISFLENKLTEANCDEESKKLILSKLDSLKNRFTDEPTSLQLYCEEVINDMENKTNQLAQKVIDLETKRYGFSLEIAGASKFVETANGEQSFNKLGLWVNANNFFTTTDAWTVTARYLTTTQDKNAINSTDLGFGYLKLGDQFNVSLEGMLRWNRQEIPDINQSGQVITRLEKDFTYRIAGQVSYQIYEGISANFSFGKNFDQPQINTKTFFSIFGLRYSLFNKRKELFKVEN